ncbi:MAG TPA: hypothetical protein VMC83_06420 [Streptosporangiaceae bacterium]|nr:hypothetical protein [Streptosporangiaceae bacterium]
MSYQDPPRHRHSSRYPTLAQYEDSYPPYQDSQRYQSHQDGFYQDTSYEDTQADNRRGNGYAGGYRGFAGLTADTPEQRPPWDNQWERPAERQQPTEWQQAPRRTSGPFFAASDDDYDDYTAPRDDDDYRRPRRAAARGQRPGWGLLAGGLAGFLAAAVAIGVANLVAAFVRPQASPIIAVGGAFIDRTPPALKNFAVEKFGENDKTMLLLGMYVTIALLAVVIGMIAWRRVAVGVAGICLFGLFGAFVAITRPDSHVTDVIPSVVGGIVGIAALVWLHSTAARRPAYRLGRTL